MRRAAEAVGELGKSETLLARAVFVHAPERRVVRAESRPALHHIAGEVEMRRGRLHAASYCVQGIRANLGPGSVAHSSRARYPLRERFSRRIHRRFKFLSHWRGIVSA